MINLYKYLIILILIVASNTTTFAQFFRGNGNWRLTRREITFGIGGANALTDLGGRDQIGSSFIYDLEPSETSYSLSAGFRYYLNEDFAIKTSLFYGQVKGDDKLTQEQFRHNRNLSFKSMILEASSVIEYHFLHAKKSGSRYKLKGAKGKSSINIGMYAFLGIGGFMFNPKAQASDGNWYALQPLSTGGQGLPGGPKPYKRISISIPMGLGLEYMINSKWKIGMEFGYRKTFTDYLDDTSGKYYNNNAILAAKGPIAAELADPQLGNYPGFVDRSQQNPGNHNNAPLNPSAQDFKNTAIRGDKTDKDAYMFAQITASYIILKRKRYGRGRGRRIRTRRSMPSF